MEANDLVTEKQNSIGESAKNRFLCLTHALNFSNQPADFLKQRCACPLEAGTFHASKLSKV
jgi:hypothetical protein